MLLTAKSGDHIFLSILGTVFESLLSPIHKPLREVSYMLFASQGNYG